MGLTLCEIRLYLEINPLQRTVCDLSYVYILNIITENLKIYTGSSLFYVDLYGQLQNKIYASDLNSQKRKVSSESNPLSI